MVYYLLSALRQEGNRLVHSRYAWSTIAPPKIGPAAWTRNTHVSFPHSVYGSSCHELERKLYHDNPKSEEDDALIWQVTISVDKKSYVREELGTRVYPISTI